MTQSNSSQPITFREAEISRLLNYVRAGESASIIGVSGTGKSNLFNHLLDPQTQAYYLGDESSKYIFMRVNFHYLPDFSNRSVYSLMLEQFELLEERAEQLGLEEEQIAEIGRYHEALLDAGGDLLKVQRYFKQSVRILLRRSERQLVFLFDQFGDVYQKADARLFSNLRGLREAYKYRISYLVFSRSSLLPVATGELAREEFYELMAPNVVGLQPYSRADGTVMLNRMASRYKSSLDKALTEILLDLTGGHAGLLRAAYLAIAQEQVKPPKSKKKAISTLLELTNVGAECDKIWNSISVEEQRLFARCALQAPPTIDEKPIQRQLELKGLLTTAKKPQLFSPLFAKYVNQQEALWERPIYLEKPTRCVWTLGKPTKTLTALEYSIFCLLYERMGEVISRDDIAYIGWPDALGGISNEAINAVMSRLRKKIEPDSNTPRFLENVRGQGYRLNGE
jgi:hypothetical protein